MRLPRQTEASARVMPEENKRGLAEQRAVAIDTGRVPGDGAKLRVDGGQSVAEVVLQHRAHLRARLPYGGLKPTNALRAAVGAVEVGSKYFPSVGAVEGNAYFEELDLRVIKRIGAGRVAADDAAIKR